MLNPNNIKGKTFDTEKNGYSKEDVKEFLGQVAEDYAEVVKANQDTEAKIIKLVEKINEYREDEEAIQLLSWLRKSQIRYLLRPKLKLTI